jgi:hypothetical protein
MLSSGAHHQREADLAQVADAGHDIGGPSASCWTIWRAEM